MTVLNFSYTDSARGWALKETDFGDFNLLVGASGVGKTRILQALRSVRSAGLKGAERSPGCSWSLNLCVGQTRYEWSATTSRKPPSVQDILPFYREDDEDDDDTEIDEIGFETERISRDGEILVARDGGTFSFRGQKLPRLMESKSAITMFKDDERMAPLNLALRRFLHSSAHQQFGHPVPFEKQQLDQLISKLTTVDQLRDSSLGPTLLKAYLLQEGFPDEFAVVAQDYRDIFPQVTELRIGPSNTFDPESAAHRLPIDFMSIGIRERNVPSWLAHSRVSSGMLRTLAHLLELALAPPGTVILIDEFENSLGVNCLPQVARSILSRKDLQFIVTSHHPYVINSVEPSLWRVVTRDGSDIRVQDHRTIPALNTASHHDAFTILMNLPELEQGSE